MPLIAQEAVDPAHIRAGLESLVFHEGGCERLIRCGLVSVIIQATAPSAATLYVFLGSIPCMRLEVEVDVSSWYVKRLAVRSSFYRVLRPTCHRLRLEIVADPALQALSHQWVT